jgi:hypothetical protein
MSRCTAHVRFRGQSGHEFCGMSAFAVAIGGKADMPCCTAYVLLTQSGHGGGFHSEALSRYDPLSVPRGIR